MTICGDSRPQNPLSEFLNQKSHSSLIVEQTNKQTFRLQELASAWLLQKGGSKNFEEHLLIVIGSHIRSAQFSIRCLCGRESESEKIEFETNSTYNYSGECSLWMMSLCRSQNRELFENLVKWIDGWTPIPYPDNRRHLHSRKYSRHTYIYISCWCYEGE